MEQTLDVTLRTASDMAAQEWEPFDQIDGVRYKVIWRDGESYAGLLHLEPGAVVPEHEHPKAHHHVFVTWGEAVVNGELAKMGAYAHVPAGVRHGLAAADGVGCTVLYLYLPAESHR
jgi:quercetin dioxygenase-like cupin family protein